MAVSIRRAESGADRDACYLIRMAVFVEEQKVPPWEEMDSYDEDAAHYLAEEDGRAVGTARLVDKGSTGKIGRVAVLADCRGKGVGRQLMKRVLEDALQHHDEANLDAQLQVIPFYESFGFVAEGEIFLDAGIEHRRMTLRREGVPGANLRASV